MLCQAGRLGRKTVSFCEKFRAMRRHERSEHHSSRADWSIAPPVPFSAQSKNYFHSFTLCRAAAAPLNIRPIFSKKKYYWSYLYNINKTENKSPRMLQMPYRRVERRCLGFSPVAVSLDFPCHQKQRATRQVFSFIPLCHSVDSTAPPTNRRPMQVL